MSESYRLPDYIDHIQQAAIDARSFLEGLTKEDFFAGLFHHRDGPGSLTPQPQTSGMMASA